MMMMMMMMGVICPREGSRDTIEITVMADEHLIVGQVLSRTGKRALTAYPRLHT